MFQQLDCELGLADAAEYRARLEADRVEWRALGALCTVSISRFYRDRLHDGGALVVGVHEGLPQPAAGFEPSPGCRAVFRLHVPQRSRGGRGD